ncbi:MAG: DUF2125 domain-containing protein [Caulobacteraceae bacterium]
MTLPDRDPGRKAGRFGLYAPIAVLILAALACSAAWFRLAAEVRERMDAQRARLDRDGYVVDWEGRAISGYPFRLDVDLRRVRVREPSGWALAAPSLKAEAFVFAPGHWVAVAPDGVVFTRRVGGPVVVRARMLRASLSAIDETPPRLSIEGLDLVFQAPRGAAAFSVTAADAVHFHTRAAAGDQGAVFFELDQARTRLPGLMGRIAAGKPLTLAADIVYDHAASLAGPDWPSAVRAWSAAGGVMAVRDLQVTTGEAVLNARSGRLAVADDGRLRGALTATLGRAPQALAADGGRPGAQAQPKAQGRPATVTVDFRSGWTTLGPAVIAPAPRVF